MRLIKLTFLMLGLLLQSACIDDNLRKIMDGKVKVALDLDFSEPEFSDLEKDAAKRGMSVTQLLELVVRLAADKAREA